MANKDNMKQASKQGARAGGAGCTVGLAGVGYGEGVGGWEHHRPSQLDGIDGRCAGVIHCVDSLSFFFSFPFCFLSIPPLFLCVFLFFLSHYCPPSRLYADLSLFPLFFSFLSFPSLFYLFSAIPSFLSSPSLPTLSAPPVLSVPQHRRESELRDSVIVTAINNWGKGSVCVRACVCMYGGPVSCTECYQRGGRGRKGERVIYIMF